MERKGGGIVSTGNKEGTKEGGREGEREPFRSGQQTKHIEGRPEESQSNAKPGSGGSHERTRRAF